MATFAEVLKLIKQAKADAQALEVAVKHAQAQGQTPGAAHVVVKPDDEFKLVNLSSDLQVHLEQFNDSMKALDFIRNHTNGGGGNP